MHGLFAYPDYFECSFRLCIAQTSLIKFEPETTASSFSKSSTTSRSQAKEAIIAEESRTHQEPSAQMDSQASRLNIKMCNISQTVSLDQPVDVA